MKSCYHGFHVADGIKVGPGVDRGEVGLVDLVIHVRK
jgi:hypothetical protein